MTKVKLDVLADIDMLLMVGKGIHWYGRANNLFMKDHDKSIESLYLKYYWDVNIFYGFLFYFMSQKQPVNDFKWFEDIYLMKVS